MVAEEPGNFPRLILSSFAHRMSFALGSRNAAGGRIPSRFNSAIKNLFKEWNIMELLENGSRYGQIIENTAVGYVGTCTLGLYPILLLLISYILFVGQKCGKKSGWLYNDSCTSTYSVFRTITTNSVFDSRLVRTAHICPNIPLASRPSRPSSVQPVC